TLRTSRYWRSSPAAAPSSTRATARTCGRSAIAASASTPLSRRRRRNELVERRQVLADNVHRPLRWIDGTAAPVRTAVVSGNRDRPLKARRREQPFVARGPEHL